MQRDQIETWAKLRGAQVLEVFEELDESGARSDRPLLTQALERIENGHSHGIVVARLDRFGRTLVDSLAAIERINRAGGVFVSVQDGLDLTTDTGRMVMRVMLSMAEWELDRIRSSWDASRERAVARGMHLSPKPPTGYRRSRSGRLIPHPADAAAVTELFRRRAAGERISALGRFLETRAVITPYGNQHWRYTSVRGVLRNRVYLGEARSGNFVNEGAHVALTDEVTWQQAQRPRELGTTRPNEQSLLAGLVRCAGCSMSMSAQRRRNDDDHPLRQYVCSRHFAGGECPAPASISAGQLEPFIEDLIFDLLGRRARPRTAELRAAEQKLTRTRSALTSYRDNATLQETLGNEGFNEGLVVRRKRVELALQAVAQARSRQAIDTVPTPRQLEAAWPTMTREARRDVIAQVLDCVFVARGRRRLNERVAAFPAGKCPVELPRRGDKHTKPCSIDIMRFIDPQNYDATSAKRPRWPRSRIERELRTFTHARTTWPTPTAFLEAGRARLRAQVLLQGGEAWWARHLDLTFRNGPAHHRTWTEDRIRATLAIYLADKPRWPTRSEFQNDGMRALRAAIQRTGGLDRWEREFPLARPHRHNGRTGYWTEDRITRELARVCDGRDMFPGRKHLKTLGLAGMVVAMDRTRGLNAWAARMGLPRQPRGAPQRGRLASKAPLTKACR